MPKKLDYPNNCSFKEAISIAELVKKAGGKANQGFIAEGLGVKENTGAFRSKIAGALKYGLIERKGQEIHLTKIGDEYFYPLPGTDKKNALLKAFKSVPIFKQILERCAGQEIDKKTLEAMLVQIFDVNRKEASRVAGYFFKANELISVLEKADGGKFKVPVGQATESEGSQKMTGKPETSGIKNNIEGAFGIDEKVFDLLINLGKLLFKSDSENKDEIADKMKWIIQDKKEQLSHSELFSDLLDANNPKIIEKLKEAIKKDMGIKETETKKESQEENESPPS